MQENKHLHLAVSFVHQKMSLDSSIFETIVSSRYITFTLPNLCPHPHLLHTPFLCIAVLDSPTAAAAATTQIAAMLVPLNRETCWTFSTEAGHLQLLLTFPHLSRLILIGNLPSCSHPTSYKLDMNHACTDHSRIEASLTTLLLGLAPRSAFPPNGDLPYIPFLTYEDDLVRNVVLEISEGPFVGEMLVEDVELRSSNGDKDFRRRLRFKRMPNLVQTQMRICPKDEFNLDSDGLEAGVEFRLDDRVLVHPYFEPMVAGLSVIGLYLDERIRRGLRPKALCLGVGGGALLGFLSSQLDIEVFGVEEDEVVLSVARRYFGLESSELIHLHVGDGIKLIEKLAHRVNNWDCEFNSTGCNGENGYCLDDFVGKFDVIMVDLDSSDAGMGTCAPPLEFVRKSVILASRTVLCELGVLIINVIPPSKSFYDMLVDEFLGVFEELHEIDVGNEENFVVIAGSSKLETGTSDHGNAFVNKLRVAISGAYMDSIRKISRVGSH